MRRWENAQRDRSRKNLGTQNSETQILGRKILGRKILGRKNLGPNDVGEEPGMSERAREFLEHWLSDDVGAVADEYRMRETVRLVALCREDAEPAPHPAGRAAHGQPAAI